MWGDVTAARNEIVNGILKRGALPMVESASSPRREQTFELVRQAKLLELQQLDAQNKKLEQQQQHNLQMDAASKNIPLLSAAATSNQNRNQRNSAFQPPLLSVPSKPETSTPLLRTASSFSSSLFEAGRGGFKKESRSQTPIETRTTPVPLLSTNSDHSKIPLLSTNEHLNNSSSFSQNNNNNVMTVVVDLDKPIQPFAASKTTTSGAYVSSLNPSRSGTPPPRNPDATNEDEKNHVPLLSTSTQQHHIPSSSTIVFPPSSSSKVGSRRNSKIVVVVTPKTEGE